MDLVRQYIVQCISTASNNLRLSSEKIEAVAVLKEYLGDCENIETSIQNMKKMTSLSKFAIKLDDVYRFIANSKIDFLKISEKFKEHSHLLIRDLSNMLDVVTPHDMKSYITTVQNKAINVELSSDKTRPEQLENLNLPSNDPIEEKVRKEEVQKQKEEAQKQKEEAQKQKEEAQKQKEEAQKQKELNNGDDLKEEYIFEDLKEKEEIDFAEFERAVLKPIKQFDTFLKQLNVMNYDAEQLEEYIEIMEINTALSQKIGFDIITNMHKIFTHGLKLLLNKELMPEPDVTESMRACLIVIVAVVRQKDVNITSYLNRAEKFGKMIFSNKRNF